MIERFLVLRILRQENLILTQRVGIAIQRPICLGFIVMSSAILGVGLQFLVECLDGFLVLIVRVQRRSLWIAASVSRII